MAGLSAVQITVRLPGILGAAWRQVRRRPELAVPCLVLAAVLLSVPPGRVDYLSAVAAGCISGLVAVSVVLGYHASEFVSFVQFALAALAGSVLAGVALSEVALSEPVRSAAGLRVPAVAAVVVAIVAGCAALGALFARLVVAPMSSMARVVPTLAGMLGMQVLLWVTTLVPAGVPGGQPHSAGTGPTTGGLGSAVLVLGAVAGAVAAAVLARRWLRSRPAATVLWAGAAGLAGVAGVLGGALYPYGGGPLGRGEGALPVLEIAIALVAAAMGGFRDAGTAVFAAVVLSLGHAAAVATGTTAWFQLALLPVVGLSLMLRRREQPPDSDTSDRDACAATGAEAVRSLPLGWLGGAAAGGVALLAVATDGLPDVGELGGYCLVALSLMVLMGWVGQVTLGQFGFAALGGWVALASGAPYPVAVLLAGLAGAALSPLVALPAVRHGGVPAPVTSMAWGIFASTLLLSPQLLGYPRLMSAQPAAFDGARGSDPLPGGYVALVVVGGLAVVAVVSRLRFGTVLAAARLDAGVASRAGINLMRWRLYAFVLTGFLAATGGGLIAFEQDGLVPSSFATDAGVRMVSWTGVAGMNGVLGAVLGSAAFALVAVAFAATAARFAVTGLAGTYLLRRYPRGLTDLLRRARRRTYMSKQVEPVEAAYSMDMD